METVKLAPTKEGYERMTLMFRAEIAGAHKTIEHALKVVEVLDVETEEGGGVTALQFDAGHGALLEKALEALMEREQERIAHFELALAEIATGAK